MKRTLVFSLIILIVIFTLSGCKKNDEDDKEILKQKLNSEISYIEGELVTIANMLNDIDYTRYKVVADNIRSSASASETNEKEDSTNKKSGEEKNSQESESQDEKNSDKGKQNSENDKSSNKVFSMEQNNILDGSNNINWSNVKNKIENLYTAWTIMSVDLKETSISDMEINDFESNMDLLAEAIKNEDKNSTMEYVISLYEFLPKFIEKYDNNSKEKNILYCKYNLLKCYKYADMEDWTGFEEALNELKTTFSNIENKLDEYKGKNINIKNAKAIINEINNTNKVQNKEIFFIKYKNLIQELNFILTI